MGLYQEQRRNRNGLSVEDGGHHFAAAPLYLFLVVGKALAAREHIVHDDDSFSLDAACNIVVSFKDAFAALALVQALAFTVYIDIIQSGGELVVMYQSSRLNRWPYFIQLLHGMNMI